MKPSEILKHLCRFVEDPEETATLTPDELDAALVEEGIDLTAGRQKLKELLASRPGAAERDRQ